MSNLLNTTAVAVVVIVFLVLLWVAVLVGGLLYKNHTHTW